jgi:hypothetical protein
MRPLCARSALLLLVLAALTHSVAAHADLPPWHALSDQISGAAAAFLEAAGPALRDAQRVLSDAAGAASAAVREATASPAVTAATAWLSDTATAFASHSALEPAREMAQLASSAVLGRWTKALKAVRLMPPAQSLGLALCLAAAFYTLGRRRSGEGARDGSAQLKAKVSALGSVYHVTLETHARLRSCVDTLRLAIMAVGNRKQGVSQKRGDDEAMFQIASARKTLAALDSDIQVIADAVRLAQLHATKAIGNAGEPTSSGAAGQGRRK